MSKRRLGKGIDALLQGRPLDQLQQMSSILMVPLTDIAPNPDQPRKSFNQKSLNELADSIREKGIIQPIIAEDRGDGTFIIVAGERRYRAAKLAGLEEVPVISQDFTADEKLEIALIENIQREDLNPIDEARALAHAMEAAGVTQDQLAKRLGKSRSAVANALRLLKLSDPQQSALADGTLTPGHARSLLSLEKDADREKLFERIQADGLSVREAELAVKGGTLDLTPLDRRHEDPQGASGADDRATIEAERERVELPEDAHGGSSAGSGRVGSGHDGSGGQSKPVEIQRLEEALLDHFGTKVVVRGTNDAGRIEIPYISSDDLSRIVEIMGAKFER